MGPASLNVVSLEEQKILEGFKRTKNNNFTDFKQDSEELFDWIQKRIQMLD